MHAEEFILMAQSAQMLESFVRTAGGALLDTKGGTRYLGRWGLQASKATQDGVPAVTGSAPMKPKDTASLSGSRPPYPQLNPGVP